MVLSQSRTWHVQRKQFHETKSVSFAELRIIFSFFFFLSWTTLIGFLPCCQSDLSKFKTPYVTDSTMVSHILLSKGQKPSMVMGSFSFLSFALLPPPPTVSAKATIYGSSKNSCLFTYLCLCQMLLPQPRMPLSVWKTPTHPLMELICHIL